VNLSLNPPQFRHALRLITAALKVQPRSPDALSNLGLVLHAQDRLDEAMATAVRALGKEEFTAAHQAGLRMTHDEAVTLARDRSWPPMTPGSRAVTGPP